MKLIDKHNDFIPYFYLPIVIIATVLFFFYPATIATTFRVHWLAVFLLLILFLTPFAKQQLGHTQKVSFLRWLTILEIAQLALNFLYAGLSNLFWHQLPVLINPINSPVKATTHYFLWQCGFFPWPLIILLSVIISYYAYCRHEKTLISVTLKPLFRNTDTDSITIFADFLSRLMIFFSLASTLGILSLEFSSIFLHGLGLTPATGLGLETIVIASILLWLISDQRFFNVIRWFTTKNFSPAVIAVIATFALSIIFLILTLLTQSFSDLIPGFTKSLLVLPTLRSNNDWIILTGMWWLSWTPLMVGLIVYLSQGHKIRTILFGGIIIIISNFLMQLLFSKTNFLDHSNYLSSIMLLIGAMIIFGIFVRKSLMTYLIRGTVPGITKEKPRTWHYYLRALLNTASFFLILYFPTGIIAISIFTLIVVFPYAVILAMMWVASLPLFFKK